MGQLMGEEPLALGAARIVLAWSEDNMLAHGVGEGLDLPR
jgi:hypothetical protein